MFKKLLLIIILILITFGVVSCGSLTRYRNGDIKYKKSLYHEIDEPFCYYVEEEVIELGHITNFIFPATYIYMSSVNENVLYNPIGSGRGDGSRFENAYVKDGYSFPDNDTIISQMYFGDFENKIRYDLDIPEESFNDMFKETEEPKLYNYYIGKDINYLYIVYDNLDTNQKIIKFIDTLCKDDYGYLYFRFVRTVNGETVYTWYMLPDYLQNQFILIGAK